MLSKPQLEADLLKVFNSKGGSNYRLGAERLADALIRYSKSAQSSLGAVSGSALDATRTKIIATFEAVARTSLDPSTYATGLATAISVMWLLPPVAFTGAPPGLVTAAIPATLAIAMLSLASARSDAPTAAKRWAAAIHTWTTSAVLVTHPVVPTPVISPIF